MTRRARTLDVDEVLRAMRRGATLHFECLRDRTQWCLSDGRKLRSWVGQAVIENNHVVAVSPALFADATPQSFKYEF